MALPAFTATQKLAEGSQTTPSAVIRALNALTTNLAQIFTSLLNRVQLDSVILQNVSLGVGQTTIPHTLGRTLSGWQVVRQRGVTFATIYDAQDSNPDPKTYLVLVSATAVNVDLEVF